MTSDNDRGSLLRLVQVWECLNVSSKLKLTIIRGVFDIIMGRVVMFPVYLLVAGDWRRNRYGSWKAWTIQGHGQSQHRKPHRTHNIHLSTARQYLETLSQTFPRRSCHLSSLVVIGIQISRRSASLRPDILAQPEATTITPRIFSHGKHHLLTTSSRP